MNLVIAHQSIKSAAEQHQRLANQCSALAGLVHAMKPPGAEPMPVENLASALLPLGLCIVHRDVVVNCLTIVDDADNADGLSGADLLRLSRSLKAALVGAAS